MTMMQSTEAERRLAAQAAAALQARAAKQGQGGIWEFISQILPAPIIMLAVLGFGGFEAWRFFQTAQKLNAETHIKDAEATLADLTAQRDNLQVNGETLALAKAKAELARAQEEARRVRVNVDALNAKVGGESERLLQLKAELAAKSALAAKTALAARAALEKPDGMLTLEQRGARAKLMITELQAAQNRMSAEGSNAPLAPALIGRMVRGYCVGNPYARLMGCPPEFITREPPRITTPLQAKLEKLRGAAMPAPPVTTPRAKAAKKRKQA